MDYICGMAKGTSKFRKELADYVKVNKVKNILQIDEFNIVAHVLKAIQSPFCMDNLVVRKIKTGYSISCNVYMKRKNEATADNILVRSKGKNVPILFSNFSKQVKSKLAA